VKNIVEAMDGFIDFKSEENKGSEFWVELPAAKLN
jgi:signal transduction histidine kinase